MEKLKRLLITGLDNDFSPTLDLITLILRNYEGCDRDGLIADKELICSIFNESIYSAYLSTMSTKECIKFNISIEDFINHAKRIKEYLKISVDKIHFDEDVDNMFIKEASETISDYIYIDYENDEAYFHG